MAELAPGDRLVCIGDSITQDGEGYVAIAKAFFEGRGTGVEVVNAGMGSNTAKDMLARFDADVLARRPTWVSIMAGVADTIRQLRGDPEACDVEQYQEVVGEMIAKTTAAGAKVALCTPTHIEYFWAEGKHREADLIIAEKAAWLREKAQAEGHLLVPTSEALLRAADEASAAAKWVTLTLDGVHLNDLGRAVTAAAFLQAFGYPVDTGTAGGLLKRAAGS